MRPPPTEEEIHETPLHLIIVGAESLEHACELLSEHGEDAKILAGGQTLIPMLNYRLARPKMLIDISNIAERNLVADEAHGVRVARDDDLSACGAFGFGGKAPAASPQSDSERLRMYRFVTRVRWAAASQMRIRQPKCPRCPWCSMLSSMSPASVAAVAFRRGEFFTTYMTTALQQDEVLESVFFAEPPKRSGWGFEEVARRLG